MRIQCLLVSNSFQRRAHQLFRPLEVAVRRMWMNGYKDLKATGYQQLQADSPTHVSISRVLCHFCTLRNRPFRPELFRSDEGDGHVIEHVGRSYRKIFHMWGPPLDPEKFNKMRELRLFTCVPFEQSEETGPSGRPTQSHKMEAHS